MKRHPDSGCFCGRDGGKEQALRQSQTFWLGVRRFCAYGILCLWACICLIPLWWLAVTSIKSVADIDGPPTYVPFVDFQPSMDSWRFILSDPYENVLPSLVNSLAIAGSATLLTLLASGLALYGFTRFRPFLRWVPFTLLIAAGLVLSGISIAGSGPAGAILLFASGTLVALAVALRSTGPAVGTFGAIGLMLATRCLPTIVVVIPLFFLARFVHLYDSVFAMALVYAAVNLPVAAWLLQPAIGLKVTDVEESALLDGATHARVLFEIFLPSIRKSVAAAGILVFILCWNEYLIAAYLTSNHAQTLPIWMAEQLSMKEAQTGGGAEEWGHMAAAVLLMAAPALLLAAYGIRIVGAAGARRSG